MLISHWILALTIAYLLGSIPFAKLLADLNGVDLLKVGSANLGMTNLWRSCGKGWGSFCLALDVSKGWASCFLAGWILQQPLAVALAAAVAIFAHTFSIWVKFKGGKGVATGLGVLLYLSPLTFAITFLFGAGLIMSTRIVSVGSLASAWLVPPLLLWQREPRAYVAVTLVAAAYISWKHRSNVQRLLQGTENKISW